jgi:acetyl esterase/lipase
MPIKVASGMTATLQRVADLRLRSSAGPTRTRVWWPVAPDADATTGLLLFFVDTAVEAPWLQELASLAQLVVVAAPCASGPDAVVRASRRDATTALEWAAENAQRLEADPGRLLVGGIGIGAALADAAAEEAAAQGWPPLAGRILIALEGYDELDGDELAADLAHTLAPWPSSSAIRPTGASRSSSSTTRSM